MIIITEHLGLLQMSKGVVMKLRELFEKDINRNINGVVKVEQVDDEAIIYQELDEFVVTKELSKHFSTFYSNYKNSFEERTDKIGVWISGFFGSGKSHFLKMLSYLLANKEVKGKKTIEFFEEKSNIDDWTFADMKLATSVPTETILFNIDSKSSKDTKQRKDGIVEVFLKVFNESQGYSSNYPKLADIERYLDKNGKYEEFKQIITSESGVSWEEASNAVGFFKDFFIKAYVQVAGTTEQSTQDLFKDVVEDSGITPEGFAKLIKEYLESKGSKNRIIFLVDEIGQFISDNTNLMLSLQTVVENLGTMCNGRAWVMVTSQEAIDSITKERFRDQDFSKIQGRFDTKLSLSGSNTDEVIKRRLLEKRTDARTLLSNYYNEQEKILANLITFSSQTSGMKMYENSDDFVDCYPFVPYQFKLLQSVFTELRNFSHAGAHLASGERSMLNAFHTALKEYGDKEITELVPFNVFYSTIQTFIDTDIVRIIAQAKEGNPDIEDFDIEVLTVLFLIKYIKEVPCDVENIATLMISNINESKNALKSKIEGALTRLKQATLIQQNGEEYSFLTNEEQDVTRGIKNTQIDSSDVLNEVYRNIYEEIYTKKSITPYPQGQSYYFVRKVDDVVRGSQAEDIEVKFITSMNSDYKFSESELKMKFLAGNTLFIKLNENGYLQELETILKTDKYIKQKSSVKQSEMQDMILKNRGAELIERKKRVKTLLEQAILESTFYTNGQIMEVSATSAAAKIENALKQIVENTYTNLHFIQERVRDEKEIHAKLIAPQGKLDERNKKALDDVLAFIQLNNSMSCTVTMQGLKQQYTRKPFGWSINDIAGVVADLAVKGDISILYNGVQCNYQDYNTVKYLTNDREIQSTVIKLKEKIDSAKIQQVIAIAQELFEKQDFVDDGEKLANLIRENLQNMIGDLQELNGRHNNPKYPKKTVIELGLSTLKELKNEPDVNGLFDLLIKQKDNLLTWKQEYKLLKSFFNTQVGIFDESLKIYDRVKRNEVYLATFESEEVAKLNELISKLESIIDSPEPYSMIKDLPVLNSDIISIVNNVLEDYKQALGEVISDLAYYLAEEASKQGLECERYSNLFKINVTDLYERATDFGELKAIEEKAKQYDEKLLKQISEDSIAKKNLGLQQTDTEEHQGSEPEIRGKELVFVNPTNVVQTMQILETEEDVDNYINKLSEELKTRIRNNKRIKLQG